MNENVKSEDIVNWTTWVTDGHHNHIVSGESRKAQQTKE